MDIDERTSNSKFSNFRAILNIAIGCLYILLGAYVMYVKAFGTLELGATTAYILGTFVILYGIFRIWRGKADIKAPHHDMRREFPSLHGTDEKE